MRRNAFALRDGHHLALLEGGQAFFPALVRAIDASEREVHLETYIFNWDVSGQAVAGALARAAARGVHVRVVMDGAGTQALPDVWVGRFQEAGVQWHIYEPMGSLGWFLPSRWRRLHRKLCVVDQHIAFCGGINVLDDFVDPKHGVLSSPRVDYAVQVTGPLVGMAHEVVSQFWWRLQATYSIRERQFPRAWTELKTSLRRVRDQPVVPTPAPVPAAPALPTSVRAGLLLRDNLRHRTRIERAYRKAIGEARREILIANAYFLPGVRLRKALIHAALRGVRVRVMLQGRYEYFLQYHATRPAYGALLAAGVEIVEYADSFLHAKVAVIDGHWATVGSSNLDPLSLLMAREANVVVDDTAFASDLLQRLERAMSVGGRTVDAAGYERRPWPDRLLSWLAYGLMRLMLFITGKRY